MYVCVCVLCVCAVVHGVAWGEQRAEDNRRRRRRSRRRSRRTYDK